MTLRCVERLLLYEVTHAGSEVNDLLDKQGAPELLVACECVQRSTRAAQSQQVLGVEDLEELSDEFVWKESESAGGDFEIDSRSQGISRWAYSQGMSPDDAAVFAFFAFRVELDCCRRLCGFQALGRPDMR